MTCPSPENLLEYAEGAARPDVAAHVVTCTACSDQLAELGAFETMLAERETLPTAERERLRAVTARTLRGEAPREAPRSESPRSGTVRRFPLWPALGVAVLAAAVLAALTLWPSPHGLLDLDVRCYPPEGAMRAEPIERFALSLRVADPRWIAIWEIGNSTGRRLLPDHDAPLPTFGVTFPLAAGDHRVPASELLDFEYSTSAKPRQLLVIATPVELRAEQLTAIDELLRKGDRAAFWPTVQHQYPEARLLDFPSR